MPTSEDTGGTATPTVALVIVSYQTRDLLETCLQSVYDHAPSFPFEICVVDNASTDGSVEMIRERFPLVRLVENLENVGYSKAVNEGFRRTSAPYVLVINPDIVVAGGAIEALVEFMNSAPRAGVVGGKLLNPDGTLQHSARTFYTLRILLLRRTFLGRVFPRSRAIRDHLLLDWNHSDVRDVDWLLGACLMIRREAASDVGLMDERFFLYFEDVDLCYRMKQRGWRVVYVPDAVMYHHHRRESARHGINRPFFWHLNSVFRFYEKWGGAFQSLKSHRKLVRTASFLMSDLIAVNLAFLLAYTARFLLRAVLVKPLFGLAIYLDLLLFVNVTTLLAFSAFGLYRTRAVSWVDEVLGVAKAASVSFLILMAGTFLSHTQAYSRTLVAIFWPCLIILVSVGRLLLMRAHEGLRGFQFDLRRVLVVGSAPRAAEIRRTLRSDPRLGCDLVGAVAEGGIPDPETPVLGRPHELPDLVERLGIHEVIFADPGASGEGVADFLLKSGKPGVDIRVMTGPREVLSRVGRMEEFLGLPVAAFDKSALFGVSAALKRFLDVLGAGVGLVVLGPPAALGAAVPGPFDRPRRWVVDCWNILLGRMSFVGPRPESSLASGGSDGRRARPGLTGPWATAKLSLEESEEDLLDLFYVQNWSLGLDLRILLESLRNPRIQASGTGGEGVGRESE